MFHRLTLGFFLVALQLHSDSVTCFNAHVPKYNVYTNYGDDTDIFCSVPPYAIRKLKDFQGSSEKLCLFYLVDEKGKKVIVLNATGEAITGQDGSGEYSYFGLEEEGECGLRIHASEEHQLGSWTCIAFMAGQIWMGAINVVKYEIPQRPIILTQEINAVDYGDYYYGDGFGLEYPKNNATSVKCCTKGGKPNEITKLLFMLDDTIVPDIVLTRHSNYSLSETCIEWEEVLTKEFNDGVLRCVADHPGFLDPTTDRNQSVSDSVKINVQYAPELVRVDSSPASQFLPKIEHDADKGEVRLHFEVRGNPNPEVFMRYHYLVDGEVGKIDKVVVPVRNVEVHHSKNILQYIVTIDTIKEYNDSRVYEIFVENEYGYDFDPMIITPPEGSDPDMLFWVLIAIGAFMTLIFLTIIFYFLNKKARSSGWLGYGKHFDRYAVRLSAKAADIHVSAPTVEYSAVSVNPSRV